MSLRDRHTGVRRTYLVVLPASKVAWGSRDRPFSSSSRAASTGYFDNGRDASSAPRMIRNQRWGGRFFRSTDIRPMPARVCNPSRDVHAKEEMQITHGMSQCGLRCKPSPTGEFTPSAYAVSSESTCAINQRAVLRSRPSSRRDPTSCTPKGIPSTSRSGTEIAGTPR